MTPTFILAMLSVFWTAAFGIPTEDPDVKEVPPIYLNYVLGCDEYMDTAFVHVPTRTLFGDQDHNFILTGDDCNWR